MATLTSPVQTGDSLGGFRLLKPLKPAPGFCPPAPAPHGFDVGSCWPWEVQVIARTQGRGRSFGGPREGTPLPRALRGAHTIKRVLGVKEDCLGKTKKSTPKKKTEEDDCTVSLHRSGSIIGLSVTLVFYCYFHYFSLKTVIYIFF